MKKNNNINKSGFRKLIYNRKKIVILFFLIMFLGTGLRIYRLDSKDLWYDEALSVYMVKNMAEISANPQPPLYYLLLHFWTKGLGESEFALRFLSLIFSTLSIYIIYKLGSLFYDKKIGLISAFILSFSPIHIWYAQEVREYSILPCLVMAFVYFFARALKEDKRCFWIGFIITATLSLYTNYFTFFIILTSGLFFLFKLYKPLAKKWLISCLVILVLFIPWFCIFIKHLAWVNDVFWVPKPNLKSIQFTFENFALGYNATTSNYLLGSISFTTLFLLGVFHCKKCKQNLLFLLLFLCIPIITSLLISQWMPIYLDRQNISVSPFYYIIIACGLTSINKKSLLKGLFWGLLVILPILSLYNYYKNYIPSTLPPGVCPKKSFKGIVNYIKANLRENDLIAHTNPSTSPIFYYLPYPYYAKPVSTHYFVYYPAEDEFWRRRMRWWEEKAKQKGEIPSAVPPIIDLTQDIKKYNFKRIWLISSSWLRTGRLEPNSLVVRKWMKEHYNLILDKWQDGVLIELYEQKE